MSCGNGKKIAELSGVSTATVSRILNGHRGHSRHTIAAVLNAAEQVAHEEAARKKTWIPDCVGILLQTYPNFLADDYMSTLMSAILETLTNNGYAAQIISAPECKMSFKAVREMCLFHHVRGLIIPEFDYLYNLTDQLRKLNLPILCISDSGNSELYDVRTDDAGTGDLAASYLWNCGHRNLGIIHMRSTDKSHQHCCEGFVHRYRELGGQNKIVSWEYQNADDSLLPTVLAFLNSTKRPTAIYCTNSILTRGFLTECNRNNIVIPRDLSLISNEENNELLVYDVTVLAHPCRKIGECAANNLLRLITGKKVSSHVVFNCTLYERSSVNHIGPNGLPKK